MQAQLIFVFLAHAFVLVTAHAQQVADTACERYAAKLEVLVTCDAREFVPQPEPVIDIGPEAALLQRLQPAGGDNQTAERVPRPDEPPTAPHG